MARSFGSLLPLVADTQKRFDLSSSSERGSRRDAAFSRSACGHHLPPGRSHRFHVSVLLFISPPSPLSPRSRPRRRSTNAYTYQLCIPDRLRRLRSSEPNREVLRPRRVTRLHLIDPALSRTSLVSPPSCIFLRALFPLHFSLRILQYYPAIRSLFTSSGPRVPFSAPHHPRQLLVSALYLLWAGRLGSFLVQVRLIPLSPS